MKYGYAQVSTDGQSVEAQVHQLTKAGCKKVFRETVIGAKTDRSELRKAQPLGSLNQGSAEHPRYDYRAQGGFPVAQRRMG